MELPQIGQHCSANTCNRLDFLPMKCDACSSIFCKDHIHYNEHQCPSSHRKNVQIPICPLCNQAVPYEYRDQSPDRVVSAHIDRDCKSDPARKKREKVYSHKCSLTSCKQREVIQVKCDICLNTFCLRHRFPDDHKCQGKPGSVRPNTSNNNTASASASKQSSQEDDDFLLAKALQESEREEARRNRAAAWNNNNNNNAQSSDKKSCSIQ